MGIKALDRDWVIGISPVDQGNKLIFAMEVSERLPFDLYYSDARFQKKKPVKNGSWRECCGDNMYFRGSQGQWVQHPTNFHQKPEDIDKDLRHPVALISVNYYYFGNKAVQIPDEFKELIWKRRGCKSFPCSEKVMDFLGWLGANFKPGIIGNPKHNPKAPKTNCL